MKHRSLVLLFSVSLFCFGLPVLNGCQRAPTKTTAEPESAPSAVAAPQDLQRTADALAQAVATLNLPEIMVAYDEEFSSGTGRSKVDVYDVFEQLKENQVKIEVEQMTFENVAPAKARLRTRLRLRYADQFRDLGEGEVVVTDVLRHFFHKADAGWKIYADERLSTYREGRFGAQPPNAQLDVPERLPTDLNYPITVTVPREKDRIYQVMVGNYAEDPAILPPPDIVTELPEDGVLKANLLPNPQGRSEMVRVTIIAAAADGQWVGATTISKFVPSVKSSTTPGDTDDAEDTEDAEDAQELI